MSCKHEDLYSIQIGNVRGTWCKEVIRVEHPAFRSIKYNEVIEYIWCPHCGEYTKEVLHHETP